MNRGKQNSELANAHVAASVPTNLSLRPFCAGPIRQALVGELTGEGIEERNLERFVDADQAGNFLQLQRRRVLQLARQGKIPAYPIGDGVRRIWRFRLSELAAAMLHSRQRSHVPEEI